MLATLEQPLAGNSLRRGKSSRDRERLVIVGNGPVGWKLCELLAERGGQRKFEVTVFGEEPHVAYDRVHLTSFFEHRDVESLSLATRAWYAENDFTLRTGDPVVEIDRSAGRLKTRDGHEQFFDRLVLATGSRAFVPPFPGVDLEGVHVYRTVGDLDGILADMDRLRERAGAKAAVLGGGLLGLEAARALHDAGLETHVFEMASVLMPKQLDTEAATLLGGEVEQLGVIVHTLTRTEQIARDDAGRLALHVEGEDEPFTFDMVVISAGIRPRDELAKAAGLDVAPRGGVVVSDKLETSDPNIYAIGECAVHNDVVYGLIAPGYHMAGVVADRLTSRLPIKPVFRGHDNATRLKLMGVDVITLGDFLQEDPVTSSVVHQTDSTYRKLIMKGRRVVGAMIVGSCDELPRLSEVVEARRRVSRRSVRRFLDEGRLWKPSDAEHVSEWPAAATVCSCMQVKRGDLTRACETGCQTVDDLIRATKASTVCGSCRPLLAELIGKPETAGGVAGWRALGWLSILSLVVAVGLIAFGAVEYADSLQSPRYWVTEFLLDDFWKQVTGFSLVGFAVVAMLLSLRKRWGKLSFGTYGFWRVFHSAIGGLCLLGLLAHTGMHLGANLNFVLMVSFLGTLVVGSVTGVITSAESKAGKPPPAWVKVWRPRVTWLHVLFTWPLPVLIVFHVLAFYMHAD